MLQQYSLGKNYNVKAGMRKAALLYLRCNDNKPSYVL